MIPYCLVSSIFTISLYPRFSNHEISLVPISRPSVINPRPGPVTKRTCSNPINDDRRSRTNSIPPGQGCFSILFYFIPVYIFSGLFYFSSVFSLAHVLGAYIYRRNNGRIINSRSVLSRCARRMGRSNIVRGLI